MSRWEFDRAALLYKLKLVAPALAKRQAALIAPQFEQLWFTDFGVFACNDQIALVTTLEEEECGFVGGVHGEKLIKLLGGAPGETVGFDDAGGHLTVEANFSAKLRTDTGDPPFVWPQPDEEAQPVDVDELFLAACKLSKVVIDVHASDRQARGLTVAANGNGLALYATDRHAMIRAQLDQPGGERPMVILSLAFVEQMLRLGPGWLWLAEDYALFSREETTLWGRYLLPEPDHIDFEDALGKRRPPGFAPLPEGFKAAIVRAGVMAAPDEKRVPVGMKVGGGTLTLTGAGPSGEVVEELDFDHAPMTLRFNQRLVERIGGLGLSHLGLTHDGLTFATEDGRIEYLIAAH